MSENTPKTKTGAGKSAPQMPDPKSWQGYKVAERDVEKVEPHGRVIGIDYEQWAVAWEDARQPAARLEARGRALEAKGYQELVGQDLAVHGVECAVRVWVLPRKLYLERRTARDNYVVARVQAGLYSDGALSAGLTRATRT